MNQSPKEELLERISEAAPTKILPSLVAVKNYMLSSKAHRDRVNDSYRIGMKLLGEEVETEDDDMGDIIVTGDIYTEQANPFSAKQPKETNSSDPPPSNDSPSSDNPPSPTSSSILPTVATVLGATGLTGAALATYLALQEPDIPEVPPTAVDTNTQYNLQSGLGTPPWK